MDRGAITARAPIADKSQASGYIRRLNERADEARQIAEHLDYVLTRLRGPSPAAEGPGGIQPDTERSPGLFRAIEEVDNEIALAHQQALKLTQQILDVLEL